MRHKALMSIFIGMQIHDNSPVYEQRLDWVYWQISLRQPDVTCIPRLALWALQISRSALAIRHSWESSQGTSNSLVGLTSPTCRSPEFPISGLLLVTYKRNIYLLIVILRTLLALQRICLTNSGPSSIM